MAFSIAGTMIVSANDADDTDTKTNQGSGETSGVTPGGAANPTH